MRRKAILRRSETSTSIEEKVPSSSSPTDASNNNILEIPYFQCKWCKTDFSTITDLEYHLKSMHNVNKSKNYNLDKPNICHFCKRVFKRTWYLQNHIKTIHLEGKPHRCHLCHQSFIFPSNLKVHISAVHDKIRSFACQLCGRQFAKRFNLRRHILTHILRQHVLNAENSEKMDKDGMAEICKNTGPETTINLGI